MGAGEKRASDADRDRVAAELRVHCVAGRLALEEFEDRLERTYRAQGTAELDELLRDLPRGREPSSGRARAGVGPPGIAPFSRRVELARGAATVQAQAIEKIAPGLHVYGYELVGQSPRALVFERRGGPRWVPLVAILAFPIGLLALAVSETQRIVVSFEEGPAGGTVLVAHGVGPRAVRKAFAELARE